MKYENLIECPKCTCYTFDGIKKYCLDCDYVKKSD